MWDFRGGPTTRLHAPLRPRHSSRQLQDADSVLQARGDGLSERSCSPRHKLQRGEREGGGGGEEEGKNRGHNLYRLAAVGELDTYVIMQRDNYVSRDSCAVTVYHRSSAPVM